MCATMDAINTGRGGFSALAKECPPGPGGHAEDLSWSVSSAADDRFVRLPIGAPWRCTARNCPVPETLDRNADRRRGSRYAVAWAGPGNMGGPARPAAAPIA